jgi:hypothetical protein
MARIIPLKLNRNNQNKPVEVSKELVPTMADRIAQLRAELDAVETLAKQQAADTRLPSFMDFENTLAEKLGAVGRAASELFLSCAEERVAALVKDGERFGDRFLRPAPRLQARDLVGRFGLLRYFRTYLRENHDGRRCGLHPLDIALGLTGDRFSWNVLSLSARLATKLSFAEARKTAQLFLPAVPSTEVTEQTVLGLGRFTGRWFADLPAPSDDGEVLIVMIDSKGAPTATERELRRRRGKRRCRQPAPSPRHRGRSRRAGYTKQQRRKKGDKSKNARMATLVVMYTLRRSGPLLLGPINRWIYASFAPKEHAFQIALREAHKRGFTKESGRLVQLVTDGDPDLSCYTRRYFPDAIHTLDIMHVIEKLWKAGEAIHPEGSKELKRWVERQKKRLYRGEAAQIVEELRRQLERKPRTGPGNKGKRERLEKTLGYLEKRLDQMNYRELKKQDLEIGSGMVEGAVKYVIGKRCDHGGMRWIKERAEALLQLRCLELNGHWEGFVAFVHDELMVQGVVTGRRQRLQTQSPAPLPEVLPLAKAA